MKDPSRASEDLRTTDPPVDPERVPGGLPGGTITGGETVVAVWRPSRWYPILAGLPTLAAIAVAAALITLVANATSVAGLIPILSTPTVWMVAALAALVTIAWTGLQWRFRIYVLTTQRVLTASGVIRRSLYETSLGNLRQTLVTASVLERCTGIGTVLLATAGTAFYDTSWTMVANPVEAQRRVQSMVRRSARTDSR